MRLALEWAQELSARLTLLHVVEGCIAHTVEERGRLAAVFEKQLRRAIPARAMEFPGLELRIEFGSAADSSRTRVIITPRPALGTLRNGLTVRRGGRLVGVFEGRAG